MRYIVWLLLVLVLCTAGCVSTLVRRGDGTTTYEQHGLVEVSPTEVATAHAIDARANTEDAWGDTLREDPALVFGFLERMANPWRFMYGGQWGSQRSIGWTDPCQFGPPCGVPLTPAAPAGGVQ
ncbi:MAG: hypothetical protein Q8K55_12005 [Gemmatimonadaceae bacterium]|nr:hypothetical protein [Gemmatimonadaceae bacterium]